MTADFFAITVPIVGAYPSVNHIGRDSFRGGRKSESYHALRAAVTNAAKVEMARTGWRTADYYVEGWITRYHPTRRKADASNLGKGELDFLQAVGVVADDTLIRPLHLSTEFDPRGEDRIVIVLLRRYPPLLVPAAESATTPNFAAAKSEHSELMGECDGVPMPRSALLRMIRA